MYTTPLYPPFATVPERSLGFVRAIDLPSPLIILGTLRLVKGKERSDQVLLYVNTLIF